MRQVERPGIRTVPVAQPQPPSKRAQMLESLRTYAGFRWLLLGTICTNTAFAMFQVALGWLALELTDSAAFVGLAGFASGISGLLLALPTGVLLDRTDRRRVILGAQIGVGVFASLFALLIFTDAIDRFSTLLLAFGYGTAMAFTWPTRQAIVGQLVQRKDLMNAVALNSAGMNTTRIVGPALAGVLIATVGLSGTFAVAAALQIFAMLTTMRLPSLRPAEHRSRGSVVENLKEGASYVRNDQVLLGTMFLGMTATLFLMPYLTLMPVFARDELDLGSRGLGFLMSATGIGAVLGALLIAGARELAMRRGLQLIAASAYAVSILIFSQMGWAPLAAVFLLIAGITSSAFLSTNQSVLQMRAEEHIRGRITAVNSLVWGLLPVGTLPIAALAGRVGAPTAMSIAALCALAAVGLIAIAIPRMRAPVLEDEPA